MLRQSGSKGEKKDKTVNFTGVEWIDVYVEFDLDASFVK